MSDKTKEVIISMLKQNTGAHFLDSGGAYGRHWEKNQSIEDWDSRPPLSVELYPYEGTEVKEIVVTLDLYHYLYNHCTFDEKMDRKFNKWCNLSSNKELCWLESMELFAEQVINKSKQGGNMWGTEGPLVVNTYNGECSLSQTLQFVQFDTDDAHYILLQIHNGCDVRGGYTEPRAFYIEETFMLWNDVSIVSEDSKKRFYTDSGYHWYDEDTGKRIELATTFSRNENELLYQGKPVEIYAG